MRLFDNELVACKHSAEVGSSGRGSRWDVSGSKGSPRADLGGGRLCLSVALDRGATTPGRDDRGSGRVAETSLTSLRRVPAKAPERCERKRSPSPDEGATISKWKRSADFSAGCLNVAEIA